MSPRHRSPWRRSLPVAVALVSFGLVSAQAADIAINPSNVDRITDIPGPPRRIDDTVPPDSVADSVPVTVPDSVPDSVPVTVPDSVPDTGP